jgi:hypothetical protein
MRGFPTRRRGIPGWVHRQRGAMLAARRASRRVDCQETAMKSILSPARVLAALCLLGPVPFVAAHAAECEASMDCTVEPVEAEALPADAVDDADAGDDVADADLPEDADVEPDEDGAEPAIPR